MAFCTWYCQFLSWVLLLVLTNAPPTFPDKIHNCLLPYPDHFTMSYIEHIVMGWIGGHNHVEQVRKVLEQQWKCIVHWHLTLSSWGPNRSMSSMLNSPWWVDHGVDKQFNDAGRVNTRVKWKRADTSTIPEYSTAAYHAIRMRCTFDIRFTDQCRELSDMQAGEICIDWGNGTCVLQGNMTRHWCTNTDAV